MVVDTSKELPIDKYGFPVLGAVRKDANAPLVSDGEYTPLQVDSSGYLKVKLVSGGGITPGSGTADPTGSVTPTAIGQFYIDTSIPKLYVATGLTSADWHEVAIL